MTVNERVDLLIEKMSLDEKIGQLNQVCCNFDDFEELKKQVKNGEISSLVLAFSELAGEEDNNRVVIEKLDELQRIAIGKSPNGIPLIYGRDVIHGFDVVLPVPIAFSASFNHELIKKCYEYVAHIAAAKGVHWAFTPMLDCSRDPRWGRIIESPGEDPYLGGVVAEAIVKGLQGEDTAKPDSIAACAKHYIGYGAAEGGRDYYNTEITDYTLRNYYLPAFKSAVRAGVKTVMTAFNEIGGQPVTSSRYLITDLLKKEIGFEGMVVSDWGAVQQLKNQGVADSDLAACELALNAGIDMDMASEVYIKNIKRNLEAGKISEESLNEAVRRVLKLKFDCGLFDNPFTRPSLPDMEEFEAVAEELSAESMVLLKNNGILPLSGKKVALMGPFVDERRALLGSWSLDFSLSRVKNFRESFNEVFGKENVVSAASNLSDEQLVYLMFADVAVIVVGESHLVTGEAHSMSTIELDEGQKQLIKKAHDIGKPVIVIAVCGRPIAMKSIAPYADAILYAWHCGTKTADAAAKIISGDIIPSGHLPVTFPEVTGQIPVYYNAPPPPRNHVSGYYNNCTQYNYRDCGNQYMYPFGYGLSYTEFEYGNLKISDENISMEELLKGKKLNLTVDVKNAGDFDGKVLVQMYIRDVCASMTRPLRQLKGFKKVLILKNKSERVTFEIGYDELAFYNIQGEFAVEKGIFEVYVGDNCLAEKNVRIEVI